MPAIVEKWWARFAARATAFAARRPPDRARRGHPRHAKTRGTDDRVARIIELYGFSIRWLQPLDALPSGTIFWKEGPCMATMISEVYDAFIASGAP